MTRDQTKPPKEYSDASILLDMEHAGRQIADEEIREQMKDCALGTPATRAAIIERLIDVGYVRRSGKNLVATEKGVHLIEAVPPEIASPETTGRWERALAEIARGSDGEARFRQGIARLAAFLVENAAGAPDVAFAKEERRGKNAYRRSAWPAPSAVREGGGKQQGLLLHPVPRGMQIYHLEGCADASGRPDADR